MPRSNAKLVAIGASSSAIADVANVADAGSVRITTTTERAGTSTASDASGTSAHSA